MVALSATDQPVNQDSSTSIWGDLNNLGDPNQPIASPCDSNGWRHLYGPGGGGNDRGPILVYIDATGDGVSGSIPGLLASSLSVRVPNDPGSDGIGAGQGLGAELVNARTNRAEYFQEQVMSLVVAQAPQYSNWDYHRVHGPALAAQNGLGGVHRGVFSVGQDSFDVTYGLQDSDPNNPYFTPSGLSVETHPSSRRHDAAHAQFVKNSAFEVWNDHVARGLLQNFTSGNYSQYSWDAHEGQPGYDGGSSYRFTVMEHGPYFVPTLTGPWYTQYAYTNDPVAPDWHPIASDADRSLFSQVEPRARNPLFYAPTTSPGGRDGHLLTVSTEGGVLASTGHYHLTSQPEFLLANINNDILTSIGAEFESYGSINQGGSHNQQLAVNNLRMASGTALPGQLTDQASDPAIQKSNWVHDVVYLSPPGWDGVSLSGPGPRKYIGLLKCDGTDHTGVPHGAPTVNFVNILDGALADDQIIYPSQSGVSSTGGYKPELIFFGGDIQGVEAQAFVTDAGHIDDIVITDPGATVVNAATPDLDLKEPDVILSTPIHPDWFRGFAANVTITTHPAAIAAAYDNLNLSITEEQLIERMSNNLGFADPLAQTFLIPQQDSQFRGIFIHSVDLCFQANQYPEIATINPSDVIVELRPCTDDGGPHTEVLLDMYGDKARVSRIIRDNELYRGYINDGDDGLPSFSAGRHSRFIFQTPIWLSEGTMYAVVVRSNDSAYRVWINDVEGNKKQVVSGSIQGLVADGVGAISGKTQYAGALFKSQNGRSWNEHPHQDLMFRINRCSFDNDNGTVEIRAGNLSAGSDDKYFDRAMLNTMPGDGTILPVPGETEVSYSFQSIDEDLIATPLSDFDVEIMENMPKRMKLRSSSEHGDFKINVTLSKKTTDLASPVIDFRNWTFKTIKNNINNGELSNTNISYDGGVGAGYAKGDLLTVYGGGATTNAVIEVVTVSAITQAIETAKISTAGLGFHKNATVNNTPSTGGSTPSVLAGITIAGEEGVGGGNARFKYITRPVVLAPGMDASNIKAYITAFKPIGAEIYLYYKVLAEEDSETFDDKSWKIMRQVSPDIGYHNSDSSIEFEFDAGDEDITYTGLDGTSTYRNFKTFAIKIVGFAKNPAGATVPIIKNLRAIAVT
jgi:hypothetical protein